MDLAPTVARAAGHATDQTTALGWTSRWDAIPDVLYSIVVEDLIMVGAVAALLTAAGKSR